MKNVVRPILVVTLGMLTAAPAFAAQSPATAKVRLNAGNVSRAAQVVARNKELFQDRERLASLIRLSKGMQQKREAR